MQKLASSLKANPQNISAWLSLGFIYQQSDEKEKAIEVYEKALEQNPNLWMAANNLAVLLSEGPATEAQLDRALELAKKAHILRFDDPTVRDTLGWIYYKKGDISRALSLMEEVLDKASENPVFNYHMGMMLVADGRTDEAKEKLEKALESGEDFEGKEEAVEVLEKL